MWYNTEVENIGMSPSGKAPDFDSGTRRFKSGHPSQHRRAGLPALLCWLEWSTVEMDPPNACIWEEF